MKRLSLLSALLLCGVAHQAQSAPSTMLDPGFYSGGPWVSKQELIRGLNSPNGVAGTDAKGNVTAPVSSNAVVTKSFSVSAPQYTGFGGTTFQYPSQFGSATGNQYELRILSNAPVNNPLRLENDYPTGLAAMSYAGWDTALQNVHEHMAVGYGAGLGLKNFRDYNYIENSCYQTKSDGGSLSSLTCPPTDFLIQQTGAAFTGAPLEERAVFSNGSTSVTLIGGGNWPDGINGQLVDTPVAYGRVTPGTVVVSGAGTSTITLSKAANGGTDEAAGTVVRIGNTEYSQHDNMVFKGMGNLDYYTFACAQWGNISCPAFTSFDFVHGRIGVNNQTPVGALDVKGSIVGNVSQEDTDERFTAWGSLNAQVDPGTPRNNILHLFGVGVNQFDLYWDMNPSRLDFVEQNSGSVPFSIYMDGSWQARQAAQPVTNVTGDYNPTNADCGTTLLVSGAAKITVSNVFPTGCKITVTDNTSAAVSIAAGGGETVGWYDTKAETGTYTLPGQYASAVIETKSGTLATVERGQ